MTTPIPARNPVTRSRDASHFAMEWLRRPPHKVIRTVPVIAVVQELLDVLRDERTSPQVAHTALRRAVRLLSIFTVDTSRQSRLDEPGRYGEHDSVPTQDQVTGSIESRQFAAAWLRGTPHAVIRTEPVIAVVQELHYILLSQSDPGREAHAALRRAVQLLGVFAVDREPPDPTI
jgi:hypothetical protein